MDFTRLFENPFSKPTITSTRLGNFVTDTLAEFAQADTDGTYKIPLKALQAAATPFLQELTGIDQNLTKQLGKTMTVAITTKGFKKQMSELEGVIARAVGGFDSEAFLEFYPHGVTEYTKATKKTIPTLLSRITAAATSYKKQLGADITAQLLSFETTWSPANKEQSQVKNAVKTSRTDTSAARHTVELALLTLIFTVAANNPGDVAACMKYFNFGLLEGVGRRAKSDSAK